MSNQAKQQQQQPQQRGPGWQTKQPPKPLIRPEFWHKPFARVQTTDDQQQALFTDVEEGYMVGYMDSRELHYRKLIRLINWFIRNGPGTYSYARYLHRHKNQPEPVYVAGLQTNRRLFRSFSRGGGRSRRGFGSRFRGGRRRRFVRRRGRGQLVNRLLSMRRSFCGHFG